MHPYLLMNLVNWKRKNLYKLLFLYYCYYYYYYFTRENQWILSNATHSFLYYFGSWSATVIRPRRVFSLMMFWVFMLFLMLVWLIMVDSTFMLLPRIYFYLMRNNFIFYITSSHICPSSSRAWTCRCASNYFMYYWWDTSLW